MFKLLVHLSIFLYVIYWLMLLLQLFGVASFTNRKMKLIRLVVPFYYWFAPTNEAHRDGASQP